MVIDLARIDWEMCKEEMRVKLTIVQQWPDVTTLLSLALIEMGFSGGTFSVSVLFD